MRKPKSLLYAIVLILAATWPASATATMDSPQWTSNHGNYTLHLQVDAHSRSIAETFLLILTIDAPIEARLLNVSPPAQHADGVRISPLTPQPPRAIATDRLRHELRFRIHPYLPGELLIEPFELEFREGSQMVQLLSETLTLKVTSLLEGDPESAELADWVEFPDEPSSNGTIAIWLWLPLLIVILIVLVIVIKKMTAHFDHEG